VKFDLDSTGSRYGTLTGFRGQGNEPSGAELNLPAWCSVAPCCYDTRGPNNYFLFT